MRRTIWSCALSCRVWVLCAYLFFFVQPSPPKDKGFVRSPIYCDPSQLPILCSSIYDILDWIVILTSPSWWKVTYLNNDIHYEVISCYLLLERGTNASHHMMSRIKMLFSKLSPTRLPLTAHFTFSCGIGCLCVTLSFHPTSSSATPSLRLHLCLHTCHLLKSRCVP